MVDTGVPLASLRRNLSEQSFSAYVRCRSQTVDPGRHWWQGFFLHAGIVFRIFQEILRLLVRASEVSGTMGPMSGKLADLPVSQREWQKGQRLLIYPGFMFIMSTGVRLSAADGDSAEIAIFASRKAALPLPTTVLMAISHR